MNLIPEILDLQGEFEKMYWNDLGRKGVEDLE